MLLRLDLGIVAAVEAGEEWSEAGAGDAAHDPFASLFRDNDAALAQLLEVS